MAWLTKKEKVPCRCMTREDVNAFLKAHSTGRAEYELGSWLVPIDGAAGKSMAGYIMLEDGTQLAVYKPYRWSCFDDWCVEVPNKSGEKARVIL